MKATIRALAGTVVAAILLTACATGVTEVGDTVKVTGGLIKGTTGEDSSVLVFKGIPYAKSPEGDLRWKEPQAVETWDGVLDCTQWGNSAIQPAQDAFWVWTTEFIIQNKVYSEDCLNLNVWTCNDGKANKPVIVYIHGGGFTSGGSSCEVYDGEEMAKMGCVYVSINYRVGIEGFLTLPELDAESTVGSSGNYGILDQIAALKWVNKNIASFGGNPANVTIMGQSAGAGSVNCLNMSPLAKGLFNKTVSLSYPAYSAYAPKAYIQGTHVEATGGKSLAELRAMSTDELAQINASWFPYVDGVILPDQYYNVIKDGKENAADMMFGFVDGDTLLFSPFRAGPDGSLTGSDLRTQIAAMMGDDGAALADLYAVSDDDTNCAAIATQIAIDMMMAQSDVLAEYRGAKDTYTYEFSHAMPDATGGMWGAFHTADVPYFFNIFSDLRKDFWQDADYEMGRIMSTYLVNFAKTGNPNDATVPEWKKNTSGENMHLDVPAEQKSLESAKAALLTKYYKETK